MLSVNACVKSACYRVAEEASQPSDDGLGEEDLEEAEEAPFYRRTRFWRIAIPIFITLSAATVGLLLTFIPSWHWQTTVSSSQCTSPYCVTRLSKDIHSIAGGHHD